MPQQNQAFMIEHKEQAWGYFKPANTVNTHYHDLVGTIFFASSLRQHWLPSWMSTTPTHLLHYQNLTVQRYGTLPRHNFLFSLQASTRGRAEEGRRGDEGRAEREASASDAARRTPEVEEVKNGQPRFLRSSRCCLLCFSSLNISNGSIGR